MAELKFVDYILDNIHGYISLTETESRIEKLPVFRRLRGIKQLGMTNWVFPGAEHTRYSHSLGVMHIADQMAVKLGFSAEERQFIRLAGMLHDIGHYPLSHVGERAYKKRWSGTGAPSGDVAAYARGLSHADEDEPSYITHTIMRKNGNPFHHELIGERVIRASAPINEILAASGVDVDDICAVITGEMSEPRLVKFVQLLHSELDADRIDYLLRDTFSSGTSYGAFEINTLIKSLERAVHPDYGVDIIGVNAKGIISADQFLINRYFVYRQVFHHKHVAALSVMGEIITAWFLAAGERFPSSDALLAMIDGHDGNDAFYNFNDSFFYDAIRESWNFPPRVARMVEMLRAYAAPDIADPAQTGNLILTGANNAAILRGLEESGLLGAAPPENALVQVDEAFLTRHTPIDDFRAVFNAKDEEFGLKISLEECLLHRLVNGLATIDPNGGISLLVDARASLTKDLCRHRTVFFRTYDIGGSPQ